MPADVFEQLTRLTALQLSGCSISTLPRSISHLVCLKSLQLQTCSSLGLPVNLALSRLTQLHCGSSSSLSSLPSSLSRLTALQLLVLSNCTSLTSLPELYGNTQLRRLDLSGCSNLTRVPETLGLLGLLTHLSLQGCSRLRCMPFDMGRMTALVTLDLQSANSLTALPQTLGGYNSSSRQAGSRPLHETSAAAAVDLQSPAAAGRAMGGRGMAATAGAASILTAAAAAATHSGLQQLDLSYCREVDSLAESLLLLDHNLAGTRVVVRGWGEVVKGIAAAPEGSFIMSAATAEQLRRSTVLREIIRHLLADRDTVQDMLYRLLWLGVMLGAATFTGAIAPPGGYQNGLPFLTFPDQAAACDSSTATCIIKPDATLLAWFFILDLLSFGFSMILVMFVVACSIPYTRGRHRGGGGGADESAGLIWLSLVLASGLLILAVACGFLALLLGLLSIYPAASKAAMLAPGMVLLA